ncbi:MAG: thiolase domain-containing protein [Halobacteria archaeon]|nr:thiolase domain-containing protein [Halobacteria archaeon]
MEVKVAGVSTTKFGKHTDSSARELFSEATLNALEDAEVAPQEVEGVYFGNFNGEFSEHQGHMGAMMSDYIGAREAESMRIDSACASSGVAFREAYKAVAGGFQDVAVAGGAETMFIMGTAKATDALAVAADDKFEVQAGLTFPGLYALMARAHMREYGTTREQLAEIAVKNHEFGYNNPYAQFHKKIDIDDVLEARMIATPLGLYDSCPITDGASAVVIVSEEYARENGLEANVSVVGSGLASDSIALQDRDSLTYTPATEIAAKKAYEQAGVDVADVDVAEVHDCFTIAEVLALEALGFYAPGEGGYAAVEGETKLGGRIPVNTSGGLKAKGHPVGATGGAQIVDITEQLRGEHPNQVDGAEIGLAHNAGGTVASAAVHILRRD